MLLAANERQFAVVLKPLSNYDYQGFLYSPEELRVPTNFVAPPLPSLFEPTSLPKVDRPGPRDHEPLEAVQHPRVRVLSAYFHAGWEHSQPNAHLRTRALRRLEAAAMSLPDAFGLAVLDAWRPLALQEAIYNAAYTDSSLPEGFVSAPDHDPRTPPHLTGGTVDVTLTWNNYPLALGTNFDDFTEDAHSDAYEATPGRTRQLRRLLYHTMYLQGFVVIDCEWWHYEIGTRRWAALTGQPAWYGPARLPTTSAETQP